MELAETRYVRIDGTKVTVAVNSADEARLAVKELRHKKKEVAHLRRALTRQRRAAEAQAARRRSKQQKRRTWWSLLGSGISMLWTMSVANGRASQLLDLPRIERDCSRLDELAHSLDSCLLQVEGKLLHER